MTIDQITEEDITLTEKILNCGTNKTKYKRDIIMLFKKYIDSTSHICTSCSMELAMVWEKYKYHYKKFKDERG